MLHTSTVDKFAFSTNRLENFSSFIYLYVFASLDNNLIVSFFLSIFFCIFSYSFFNNINTWLCWITFKIRMFIICDLWLIVAFRRFWSCIIIIYSLLSFSSRIFQILFYLLFSQLIHILIIEIILNSWSISVRFFCVWFVLIARIVVWLQLQDFWSFEALLGLRLVSWFNVNIFPVNKIFSQID